MDDSVNLDQATTAVEPIPSYRPDAKARRYDRQLRLWASAGQRSLEAAKVLLVGADATGCQALKNLVLPGIAEFTILSSQKVQPQDVATNFFLHPDSVGQSIAQQTVSYLKELNPSVQGHACLRDPEDILSNDPDWFLSFTLIIVSNAPPKVELALADLLWTASERAGGYDIPLIAVRDSGFVGRIEIQLREHCISDTHPEQTHTLRIDQPFPALEKLARSIDLDNMDSMEHSHVPWVVILVRAVSIWKEQHGGKLPSSDDDAERAAFKEMIKSWRHKADEENFEEAINQAYKGWNKTEIDYNLVNLFKEPAVQNIHENSKNLHILLKALSQYVQSPPHLPPISPSLPDMHSSTTSYVALQNLFKAQFKEDLAGFREIVISTLRSVGLPEDTIPEDEIENFARNVGGVDIIKGRSLRESKEFTGLIRDVIADQLEGSVHLGMQIALLASERFHSTHGRWPGTLPQEDMLEDKQILEQSALEIVKSANPMFEQLPDEVIMSIAEVTRGGFSTLPTTAAFLGGIVAQEAIKLVTNQYMPLDNTVIADLIRSSLEKFKF